MHPSQRFDAPSTIQTGTPLKALMGPRLVKLIGQSLTDVVPGFQSKRFQERALRGLDDLELKDRALNIAHAMAEQMPGDFDQAARLLIDSMGPTLESTKNNGLKPFYYLPHSQMIAVYGVEKFESGMLANYELTKRFTAEFSIRPFLVAHQSQCLIRLRQWCKDPDHHVRRLVSEGTRPRLPWAMRLPEFQRNPKHTLALLELLKDDPELYVRRSVANHLGDVAKDHPDLAFDLCEKWVDEVADARDRVLAKNRFWMVRHAVRLPAKKKEPRALELRAMAAR